MPAFYAIFIALCSAHSVGSCWLTLQKGYDEELKAVH